MKVMSLPAFGIDNLQIVETDTPEPGAGEILIKLNAASINYRDYQIVTGEFAPTQRLPIIPLSDGAGEIVAAGSGVEALQVGDRVAPLFFPEWQAGEALADERKLSSGLEVPGVAREYGVYLEHQVVKIPDTVTAVDAACMPCAGLTAWSSLVTRSNIGPGDWVLVQGTGGVSLIGLQIAKALGASVIVTSSSREKLSRALELGADHGIDYNEDREWGNTARKLTGGRGVDAVLEIGGTGTMSQSVAALRRGGHVNAIGYLAGIDVGLSVFELIERNAQLHGISVGNREGFEQLMAFVAEHAIRPPIAHHYEFSQIGKALLDISKGEHFGKLVVDLES